MIIGNSQSGEQIHLTYCLNVHPGESWSENFQAIREKTTRVRDMVCRPNQAFGLGLRLSAAAAAELVQPAVRERFTAFLAEQNMYVFTVNGFPYGQFHGRRVKADVYAPDWSTPERLDYTVQLANVLAGVLKPGVSGSISTVPGTYRTWCTSLAYFEHVLLGLCRAAWACRQVEEQTGQWVRIAIEPEPDCLWDSVQDVARLFTEILPDRGARLLAKDSGCGVRRARAVLQRYLGICLDTCHQAVLFENVARNLRQCIDLGIPVCKIQVSAAVKCELTPRALDELEAFADPTYLHQTCLREDANGEVKRYPDIPAALENIREGTGRQGELRTHFHVPLTAGKFGGLQSTRDTLTDDFWDMVRAGASPHLEVETYTFNVLPPRLRRQDIAASTADELKWVLSRFGGDSTDAQQKNDG